jgi:hypothetical protein
VELWTLPQHLGSTQNPRTFSLPLPYSLRVIALRAACVKSKWCLALSHACSESRPAQKKLIWMSLVNNFFTSGRHRVRGRRWQLHRGAEPLGAVDVEKRRHLVAELFTSLARCRHVVVQLAYNLFKWSEFGP